MTDSFTKNLVSFFKAARHLWGRCPNCGDVFRLSDAAISPSPNPPRDWLSKLQRQQAQLRSREATLNEREREIDEEERDVRYRELHIERDAKARVREILRSKTEYRAMIRQERKAAVLSSRRTLLGKLLERITPCFTSFSQYDPRDLRCISDPFDYVLFDGLTVERRVRQIALIEVKCGMSRLNPVQRSVRDVVERGRIHTEVWTVGDPTIPITKQLSNSR